MNLNHPAIDPGMLSAADLEDARRNNPGSIWHPHRHIMAAWLDQQGCYETRTWGDSCAPEGGEFHDPVPSAVLSMRRHDRMRYRVALALLLGVAGYLSHLAWPLLAA